MDIHLNFTKVTIGLMVLALVIGGLVGGAIGFVAGSHEGGDRYEMQDHEKGGRRMEMNYQADDHADGETNDDKGGMPNSDENMPIQMQATSSSNGMNMATSSLQVRP